MCHNQSGHIKFKNLTTCRYCDFTITGPSQTTQMARGENVSTQDSNVLIHKNRKNIITK
jgi:hypothetical protein